MSATSIELPFCKFPTAAQTAAHGTQTSVLDKHATVPVVQLPDSFGHDETQSSMIKPMCDVPPESVIAACQLTGKMFALREPMTRWFRIRSDPGAALSCEHHDAFSHVQSKMAAWTIEEVHVWFPRLLFLTDITKPGCPARQDSLSLSLTSFCKATGALNGALMAMPIRPMEPPSTKEAVNGSEGAISPVYQAVTGAVKEVLDLLTETEYGLQVALCAKYERYAKALQNGKVVSVCMISKADGFGAEVAFNLLCACIRRCQVLGYEYVVTDATSTWTGAAFERLGAVPVYFAPFIGGKHSLARSDEPLPDTSSSPNGWLADKDSGAMSYCVALN